MTSGRRLTGGIGEGVRFRGDHAGRAVAGRVGSAMFLLRRRTTFSLPCNPTLFRKEDNDRFSKQSLVTNYLGSEAVSSGGTRGTLARIEVPSGRPNVSCVRIII